MTSPKDYLWLAAQAIVKAAARDGDKTEISTTVQAVESGDVQATIGLTIGSWDAQACVHELTPRVAARECLLSLDRYLERREILFPHPITARVRTALANFLSDQASSDLDVGLAPTIPPPAMRPTIPLAPPDRVAAMRRLLADALGGLTRARGLWSELSHSERVEVLRTASNEASRLIGAL